MASNQQNSLLAHENEMSSSNAEEKRIDSSTRSLDSVLALFEAGDDTSNFVAISLLRSILDDRKELREDRETLAKCWNTIPTMLLIRLLKSKPNKKRTEEEAQSMVGLAVAIIHVFFNLLPPEVIENQLRDRTDDLIAAVPFSSPETVSQISQILLALNFPSLLFSDIAKTKGGNSAPSSYLFIKMLLIDIRSTISSLQEKLNSPEYLKTSMRIAESFNIISSFIGYLMRCLDEDDSSEGSPGRSGLQFEPSQLLQLRADISETMSLTIEHMRDRFDASVAGAAGLHPSARITPTAASSAPRAISWQSSDISMSGDPLTLSETRALALWLREDDNDTLRREAAGIIDVLFNLYSEAHSGVDFRSPVLIALEGILAVPEGVEAFLKEEGWSILSRGLQNALESDEPRAAEEGVDTVRVLLAVAESEVTGPSKEDWLNIVGLAVKEMQGSPSQDITRLDLGIAVSQLAVELLIRAPKRLRRRYASQVSILSQLAGAKLGAADGEREEGLIEVIGGLEDLEYAAR
ncbi:MAG: hypothetical protein Q9195_001238 [Heterodermia aff. obscurata]